MAKVTSNILGTVHGRLGEIVASTYMGKQTFYPFVKPANPRTKAQMLVRAKFTMASQTYAAFTPAADLGLKQYARRYRCRSLAALNKLNFGAITGDNPEQLEVDFSLLKLSDGKLTDPGFSSASAEEAMQVDVNWTPNIAGKADAADKVYVFVYQEDLAQGLLSAPTLRSAGAAHVTVPAGWSGMRVHVWGFAIGGGASDKGIVSPSTYLGSAVII